MTVAEQIAANAQTTWVQRVSRVIQVIIAVVVIVLALLVVRVNQKTNSAATQAKQTASVVKTALGQSVVAICQSRATTLGSAPVTVRDYRAIVDAESAKARLVCPHLDYAGLKRHRLLEIKLLATGVPAEEIASTPVEPVPLGASS